MQTSPPSLLALNKRIKQIGNTITEEHGKAETKTQREAYLSSRRHIAYDCHTGTTEIPYYHRLNISHRGERVLRRNLKIYR